jgi:putative tricarboxylic transport membrane protein
MEDGVSSHRSSGRGVARWAVELGTGIFVVVVGAVFVYGSLKEGIGWTSAVGPESGYFPFYIGVLIVLCGIYNAAAALITAWREQRSRHAGEIFLEYAKFKPVLHVFVPMAIYVFSVRWLGLYISSALFVGLFMMWHGKYRWQALWVGVGTPLFFYLVLELWFKIDLYKGPLLDWLLGR